jgi:hypothetical protein
VIFQHQIAKPQKFAEKNIVIILFKAKNDVLMLWVFLLHKKNVTIHDHKRQKNHRIDQTPQAKGVNIAASCTQGLCNFSVITDK